MNLFNFAIFIPIGYAKMVEFVFVLCKVDQSAIDQAGIERHAR